MIYKRGDANTMLLIDFAEKYKVNIRKDSCGHEIIPGFQSQPYKTARQEHRSHIFEGFKDGRLGLCLMLGTAKKWGSYSRQAIAAGFTLKQNGHTEGTLLFDPTNATQARLALKLAKVRRNPTLTSEQRKAMSQRMHRVLADQSGQLQADFLAI